MFTRTILVGLVLVLTGCTTVKTINLSESSPTLGPPTFSITLTDGQQREVLHLQVRDDSTSWINPTTGEAEVIATAQIATISHDMKVEDQHVTMRRTVPPSSFDPTVVAETRSVGRSNQTLAKINRLARKRKSALIALANGRALKVSSLQVTPDSTSWLDPETGRFESVATAEIREIRFVRHGKGALEGLGIGFFGGFFVGFCEKPPQFRIIESRCIIR